MPFTPYQPYQPFKPSQPTGTTPPVNRNWSTGQTAWDPKGLFGTNQQTGMTSNPNPTWNFQTRANPTAGMVADPGNTDVASSMPNSWNMPNTYQDTGAGNTNVATPTPMAQMPATTMNGMTMGGGSPAPTWNNPAYSAGYDPGAFTTQYGTYENLQPYMNPFLDQIINRGNNAIQSSAAARGLLQSSGTINDIGDWTAQAQGQAFNDARNAFNNDRNYMTDAYFGNYDRGYRNYRDTDKWNYGLFQDEKSDYDTRMRDWYNQINGITQTGIDATDKSGALYAALGQALAGLYGEQGNTSAAGLMGGSAANRGLVGNILGMFFGG